MAGNIRLADGIAAIAVVGILTALLSQAFGRNQTAEVLTVACGCAVASIIANRSGNLWAYLLPAIGVFQLLPIGSTTLATLRTDDAWLLAELSKAGIEIHRAVSTDRLATIQSVIELAGYASLFLITANIRSPHATRAVLAGIVCLGLWQVAEGTAQLSAGRVLDDEIHALAHGSFVNRNHYAAFLETAIGSGAAIFGFGFTALASGIVFVTGIVFSYSRAGIVIAAISLTALSVGHKRRALAGIATLAIGLAASAHDGYLDRFLDVGDDIRPAVWRDSLYVTAENPWLGGGLGTFSSHFTRSEMYLLYKSIEHAHNDYLELAVELGWPLVTMLAVALTVAFTRSTLTNCGAALGAGMVLMHAAVDSPLHSPVVASTVAVLVAIGWHWKPVDKPLGASIIPIGFTVVGILFAIGAFSRWDASTHYVAFSDSMLAGDPEAARESLRQGLRANPRSAVLWTEAALLSEARGDVTTAGRQLAVARRLEPFTLRTEWTWADFSRRNGSEDEAERTFRHIFEALPELVPEHSD